MMKVCNLIPCLVVNVVNIFSWVFNPTSQWVDQGKILTGNHRFFREIWDFPVIVPLNQPFERPFLWIESPISLVKVPYLAGICLMFC